MSATPANQSTSEVVCADSEKLPEYTNKKRLEKSGAAASGFRRTVLWKHRSVWFLPLAGEALLLLAAANLVVALANVIQGRPHEGEWIWLAGACAVFVVTRLITALGELFMPRFVALTGVGTLGLIAIGLVIGLLVPLPWHESFTNLGYKDRLLVALPLALFLFRTFTVIRASRYSPGLRDMDHYSRSMSEGFFERGKKRLEFWMR